MLNIGWFSTGRGEGSRGLFQFIQERILQNHLDARIQFVFSNREPGESRGSDLFFETVNGYDLPLITFSSRRYQKSRQGILAKSRAEYDLGVMTRIASFKPDVCILAGYMLILSPEICDRYSLINIHPALPSGPTGTWQEVIWNLIETRSTRTGAMLHLVTEKLDRGPVISYFNLPLTDKLFTNEWRSIEGKSIVQLKDHYGEHLPLFQLIRSEEYRREPHLLLETLKPIARGTIRIENKTLVDINGNPIDSLCMNSAIENSLASQ